MRIKETKFLERRYDEDMDIYSEDVVEDLLDSDSIEIAEGGFMMGYNEA